MSTDSPAVPIPDAQPAGSFVGTDGAARADRRNAALAAMREDTAETPSPAAPADSPAQRERPAILAPEATSEPEADRVSVAVRAREKAARMRAAAESERQSVARDRMQVDADRYEMTQLRAAREMMAKDPVGGLKAMGLDVRDLMERAAIDGSPDAQIRELTQRLSQQEAASAAWQKSQHDAEHNGARSKAEGAFFALAADGEKYPHLAAKADFSRDTVSRDAYRLQEDYYQKTGKVPSIVEIVEALDYLAAQEYDGLAERHARRGANVSRPTGTAPVTVKAKPSRTMSAAHAGEKSQVAATTKGMTRDERKAYALAMLTGGRL